MSFHNSHSQSLLATLPALTIIIISSACASPSDDESAFISESALESNEYDAYRLQMEDEADRQLPLARDRYWVHPKVSYTIFFGSEYGGMNRLTADTAAARDYVASLPQNVPGHCIFFGKSTPCMSSGAATGCAVTPNRILFESATCVAFSEPAPAGYDPAVFQAEIDRLHMEDKADALLPLARDTYWVHPTASNTIFFGTEYGGLTRLTAKSEEAKAYVAGLSQNTPYSCAFRGKTAPCLSTGGPTGCNLAPNRISFESIVCSPIGQ